MAGEGAEVAAGLDGPLPPGMDAVHVGVPLVDTALAEVARLGAQKVFVLSGRSCAAAVRPLLDALDARGLLAAPLCCEVGMGGGEDGVLAACVVAAAAAADCVVTIGGGAVQDAGKLVRLWLGTASPGESASVAGLQAAAKARSMPKLPPQVACPNSFAMAELTQGAGIATQAGAKAGASHPAMVPSVVIFDPSLADGLPDWVRFGTALRGVEHAVGAVCSPAATEEVRTLALRGLALSRRGLEALVAEPSSRTGCVDCYRGGWLSIRALFTGCYPAIGHFIENQYSARFDVHQGSCSGILCARILAHHADASTALQARLAEALGRPGTPLPGVVAELVRGLPGVAREHEDVGVSAARLAEFAEHLYSAHGATLNSASPKPFASATELLAALSRPLARL